MNAGIALMLASSLLASAVLAEEEQDAAEKPRSATPPPIRLRAEPVKSSHFTVEERSVSRAPPSGAAVTDAAPTGNEKDTEPDARARDAFAAPNGPDRAGSKPRAAAAEPQTSDERDNRDLQFLTAAFEHGQTQLFLGELAKTRAETEQIRAVGVVISSTQAEENKKLLRLAAKKGITLPRGEGTLQKEIAAKLEKMTGAKFEKQLMEEMINVNQRAVANYELASGTHDADIKTFIEQGLPLAKEKLLFTNKMTGTARRSDKQPGFRGDVSTLPE